MALKCVLEAMEVLDGVVTAELVSETLRKSGIEDITVIPVEADTGSTEFIRIKIPGLHGKSKKGNVPTLGIIGRLGGVGARPEKIGIVSDADGAVTAIATALKISKINRRGDILPGDVIIATHICPNAPTIPHNPVYFMGSPVDMDVLNKHEVCEEMDAILSVDATKGNKVLNCRGIAITPTIKEGYILPISDTLLNLLSYTTGRLPRVLPLSTYDITPYGNGLYHINSILQPAVATSCPVVGVAITSEVSVPGCATGANQEIDIAEAVRFCIETAKEIKRGIEIFYEPDQFLKALELYGPMKKLQNHGD